MITKDEMTRLRRQMHRRIRVVLAQRRMTAMPVSLAGGRDAPPRELARSPRELPRQRDDEPAPVSCSVDAEPVAED